MKGNVLIVDYGGGTLDLTLTQVSSEGKDQEAVEIEVKQRTGVGDNHPGRIGDAGIAYMEKVIRLAVAECPDLDIEDPEELDPKEPIFWKAYTNLERKLKGAQRARRQRFLRGGRQLSPVQCGRGLHR